MLRKKHPVETVEQPKGFDDFETILGDVIRGERATLGKTLEDVENDLRIKKVYIEAIENADADAFTSKGFISGYVRSYARYLGLDPDAAFARFCQESGYDGLKTSMEIAPNRKPVSTVLIGGAKSKASTDPFLNPRVPNRPETDGVFAFVSASGVASIAVLAALIGALGYGGWAVLQEVQRVQFAPVNSTPGVTSEITSLGVPDTLESDVVADLPQIPPIQSVESLYRPQELEVPQLVARDGPIAAIDPRTFGSFAPPVIEEVEMVVLEQPVVPKVTVEGPPPVDIVAVNPAWIRVFQKNGEVLFEKTLDAGQRYRVPADVAEPMLRAGNSGSVYVMIGEKTYGPVGVKTGVARKVELTAGLVEEKYGLVADLFQTPLAEPVNFPKTAEAIQN